MCEEVKSEKYKYIRSKLLLLSLSLMTHTHENLALVFSCTVMQKRVITQRGEAWEETWKRTKRENVWSCEGETYFGGCCFFLQVLLGRVLYTQTLHGALFGQAWHLRLHSCALAQPLCSRHRKHTTPPSVIVIMLTVIEHTRTHTHTHTHAYSHTHTYTHTHTCMHTHTNTHTHNYFICSHFSETQDRKTSSFQISLVQWII